MDKIIVLIIFSCDGEPTVPQVHYYHGNSTICARFCCSSGERFRSSCPVPIIIVVLPCGSSRAERLCDPSELRVRRLTPHRLGRALRSPTAGSAGSGCKPSRRISRQSVLIRRPAFPPTFSAAALAVSAAIDCEHVDARGRELRNASGPGRKENARTPDRRPGRPNQQIPSRSDKTRRVVVLLYRSKIRHRSWRPSALCEVFWSDLVRTPAFA